MRVIAGKYKRTPIRALEGEDITRPTRDMVKEALFSSIDIYSDTSFLDLFSGTGAIGIEALSRGAETVVFNDLNKKACAIIKANLEKVKEDREVYNLDYQECLKKMEKRGFDYIFVDPPYRFGAYDELFYYVTTYDVMDKKGIIVVEASKETMLNDDYLSFHKYKERKYGISKLIYYRKEDQ